MGCSAYAREAAAAARQGLRQRHSGAEDAARVEDARGVEDRLQPALEIDGVRAELVLQPAALEQAHPVLTGERATERDRRAEQLVRRAPDVIGHAVRSLVDHEVRV